MNAKAEPARLVRAKVSNVLGIKLAEIKFDKDGGLVVVGGENGAGKSSLLDALRWAFDGKKPKGKKILRHDEEKGVVILELAGEVVEIKRSITEKGDYLKVTGTDGGDIKAPQGVLNALIGTFGIDPSEFVNLGSNEQTERVQKVMGVDFADLDEKQKTLYEERTNANRRVRDADGEIRLLPPVEDGPGEKVVVSDLLVEIDEADKRNKARVSDTDELESLREKNGTLKTSIKEAEATLARLQAERDEQIVQGKQLAEKVAANAEEAALEISEGRDSDSLRAKLKDAEVINERVEASVRRTIAEGKMKALKATAEKLDGDIIDLATERAKRIAAAPISIHGIDIQDGVVCYDGKPFSEASDGQQLLIAFEIAAAGSPDLKILFMRQGGRLDLKNRQAVAETAIERGYTVVMEVVGTSGIDVLIENGVAV